MNENDRCFRPYTGEFQGKPMTVPCDLPRRLHPIDGKGLLVAHEFTEGHDPDLVATIRHGDPRTHYAHDAPHDDACPDSDITPDEQTRLQAIVNDSDSDPGDMMAKVEQEAITMGMARARSFLMLDQVSGKDSGWPVWKLCGDCISAKLETMLIGPPFDEVDDIVIRVDEEVCQNEEKHS